jgi:hypothetical protein
MNRFTPTGGPFGKRGPHVLGAGAFERKQQKVIQAGKFGNFTDCESNSAPGIVFARSSGESVKLHARNASRLEHSMRPKAT